MTVSRLMPLVHPAEVDLSDAAAVSADGLGRGAEGKDRLEQLRHRIEELVMALGAEARRAVLVVLQARDAGGKDGVIRRVFGDLNPAYCRVTSFKRPTPLELRHDFLWRIHQHVPPAGTIGIFNRSHYEDVLVVRVHEMVPESVWRKRYQHINEFERMLTDHGVTVLKFLLHISREEQRLRLEDRLADPTENWKFEVGDLKERSHWDDYTEAYREMVLRTSTEWAPWYVVPSDRKKGRDTLIGEVMVRVLEEMNPQYPPADPGVLDYRGRIA